MYRNLPVGNNQKVEFTTMTDRAFTTGKEIMLLGDFNIDLYKSNRLGRHDYNVQLSTAN